MSSLSYKVSSFDIHIMRVYNKDNY